MTATEEYEENIQEFLDTHGMEGFLKLYFTNFLVEMIQGEAKTESEGTDLIDDPGVQFYFKGHSIEDENDLREFEDALFDECMSKSEEMVEKLKEDEKFEKLFAEEFNEEHLELLDDPELEDRFEERMHELFEEWEDMREED